MEQSQTNHGQLSCICCTWPKCKELLVEREFFKAGCTYKNNLIVSLHSKVFGWQCNIDSFVWFGYCWFLRVYCLL